jgi:cytidylate kinase
MSSVIAIDGPAGAGKTTVAKGVARALGFRHLDTGAMYRAIAAKALAAGIDPSDERALAALARSIRIDFDPGGIRVDGKSAGKEIRTAAVNRVVSAVSAHPGVRRAMVRRQRAILRDGAIVAEGRDIGTVVFPRALVKVFLTASVEERARRRHREIAGSHGKASLQKTKREIARRDALDSTRPVSPLVPATDAVVLDSTGKRPSRVIAEIVELAKVRLVPGESAGARPRARSGKSRSS